MAEIGLGNLASNTDHAARMGKKS